MIFAHLGGVDEIGIFLVPAVIAILTLRWAEKRAKRRAENLTDLKPARSHRLMLPRWSNRTLMTPVGAIPSRVRIDGMEQRSPIPAEIAERTWDRIVAADLRVLRFLNRHSLTLLRFSLAVVFIWFGGLKLFGMTPVAELVSSVVYWVDPNWFVPFLGVVEIALGVGLLFNVGMRIVLLVFLAQMTGTLLVLIIRPDIAFQNGNPLLLTTEGEFVIKNLVLISAGLTVGARLQSFPPWRPAASSSPDGDPVTATLP